MYNKLPLTIHTKPALNFSRSLSMYFSVFILFYCIIERVPVAMYTLHFDFCNIHKCIEIIPSPELYAVTEQHDQDFFFFVFLYRNFFLLACTLSHVYTLLVRRCQTKYLAYRLSSDIKTRCMLFSLHIFINIIKFSYFHFECDQILSTH